MNVELGLDTFGDIANGPDGILTSPARCRRRMNDGSEGDCPFRAGPACASSGSEAVTSTATGPCRGRSSPVLLPVPQETLTM